MTPSIAEARLYLVAPLRLRAGLLADLVAELGDAGVDLVQLREKEMEAGDLLRGGEPLRAACAAAGIPFIVNDRPDVARALDADGVHLGQNDLPVSIALEVLGRRIVGRSTHSREEVDAELVADPSPGYIAVGPVFETPTKPGRAPTGLGLLRHAALRVPKRLPWFAIGGLDAATLPAALEAGARRIVVVRAVTEADDPPAAAARLKSTLDALPL